MNLFEMLCDVKSHMYFQNWLTFSPIADLVSVYYDINAFKVNVLSLVFMVASIPFGFIASWVLDTFGLRASVSAFYQLLQCLHVPIQKVNKPLFLMF